MGPTLARNDNDQKAGPMAQSPSAELLAGLRARIAACEAAGREDALRMEGIAVPADRQALATEGPQSPGLYELWAERPADIAPAAGLLLSWVAASEGPLLWVTSQPLAREYGLPYGPGLLAFGLDPARVILVRARDMQGALWAVEEGLRSGVPATVVGECTGLDLTASRRLALVAREQAAKCLMIVRTPAPPGSAAHMRWRVAAQPGSPAVHYPRAPGPFRLRVDLVKDRGGLPPHSHELEWHHATHHFRVAAPLAGRTLAEGRSPGLAAG